MSIGPIRPGTMEDKLCTAVAIIAVVLAVIIGCGAFARADNDATNVATGDVANVATSPGRPLDAVRYEAPTMSGGKWCYLMYDRTHGCMWWLMQMPASNGGLEWLALPVECDGELAKDLG